MSESGPATALGASTSRALEGQGAVDALVTLLDLSPIDDDVFEGISPDVSLQRIFGGQVAGQALVAAGRTVPADRQVHSLHAYFLRPGDPSMPIRYSVDRIRDGHSFTTRRVVAHQDRRNGRQEAIFQLSASFQTEEEALVTHDLTMPDWPDPEDLPTFAELVEPIADQLGHFARIPRPLDRRYAGNPWAPGRPPTKEGERDYIWMRADGKLPDDPLIHVCVLTFASDISLLEAGARRAGIFFGSSDLAPASLDHAMWFHRPIRADEWFLYSSESPSATNGRALCEGQIWSRDGRHLATVMQEGLIRRNRRR